MKSKVRVAAIVVVTLIGMNAGIIIKSNTMFFFNFGILIGAVLMRYAEEN